MELKSIKRLLLLLCLFCLALNEKLPAGNSTIIKGNIEKEQSHTVTLESYSTYDDYIRIRYIQNDPPQPNPFIYVSTNSECKGQSLFVSTQFRDPIYIFLKKDQIQNEFYICLKSRITSKTINYVIEVTNSDKAILPFNAQTSYYISDDKTKSMDFLFERKSNSEISITCWAKGKNITSITSKSRLTSQKFEAGYLLYGNIGSDNEFEANVEAEVGDYVNVGLIEISGGYITPKLEENGNEIIVAVRGREQKTCAKLNFTSYMTHITGKVYNKYKAKTYFLNSNKEEIKVEGQSLSSEIKDGLISEPKAIK